MKISPYIIYLEMQPNALLLRQNFDSQKVSVTTTCSFFSTDLSQSSAFIGSTAWFEAFVLT
jgi:hypothetical protein